MRKKIEVIVCDLCPDDTPSWKTVQVIDGENKVDVDVCRSHYTSLVGPRVRRGIHLVVKPDEVLEQIEQTSPRGPRKPRKPSKPTKTRKTKTYKCRFCPKRLPTPQGKSGHERIVHRGQRPRKAQAA